MSGEFKQGELASWKEVATFLRVSIRTAQKWEREKGLPVHRMPGSAGRVSADPAELARWKERVAQRQPWWARANLRVYYGVALPVLLLAVLMHDVLSHYGNPPRVPSSYRMEWNELVVLDAAGAELWRKAFPKRIEPLRGFAPHVQPPVHLHDMDRDGKKEVLFVHYGADFDSDAVICYSAEGDEMWRFNPPPPRNQETPVQTTITNLSFGHRRGPTSGSLNNKPMLLIGTCTLPDHKDRLFSINERGRSVELLHDNGHLDHLDLADVDLDGITEIAAGGFDARRHQAKLYLLHPPASAGESAAVEAEIFFPRTALNRKLAEENRVFRLTAAKGRLQVSTLEWLDQRSHVEICYALDNKLQAHARFCGPIPLLQRNPLSDLGLEQPADVSELADLTSSVEVVPHGPLARNVR